MIAGAAKGLRHMHVCGVLHRDISTSNVGLGAGMAPKLLDFGLSVVAPLPQGATPAQMLTVSRALISAAVAGTPGYIDPDVVHSPGAYHAHSDVYSFGVVILEVRKSAALSCNAVAKQSRS
jgi:serine/threonine protein kinase